MAELVYGSAAGKRCVHALSRISRLLDLVINQARITLARAIYSTAEILLLDDVLSALDVHTSQWIVRECFRGDLVRGRTIILVVSLDINLFHAVDDVEIIVDA